MGYGKAKKSYALGLFKRKKKPKSGSSIPDVNKDGKIDSIDFAHFRANRGKKKTGMYKDTKPASTSPSDSTKSYSIKPKEKKKKVKTDYQYPPSKTKKSVEKNSKFFRTRRLVDKYKSDPPNNVLSDKEFLIKNPFDTSKRLYSRRVVRGKAISSGKPTKTIVTRGESYGSRKAKIKNISEKELNRDYKRNKKKIEKNYSIAVKSEKKFKPHTMYDPKTGKGVSVNKVEDHLKLKKKGFSHSKKNYSLYVNINKRRAKGISRSKANSTVSKKSYDNMKKGFK